MFLEADGSRSVIAWKGCELTENSAGGMHLIHAPAYVLCNQCFSLVLTRCERGWGGRLLLCKCGQCQTYFLGIHRCQ